MVSILSRRYYVVIVDPTWQTSTAEPLTSSQQNSAELVLGTYQFWVVNNLKTT